MVTPTDDGGYKLTKREFTKLAAGGSIVMQSDDGGWLSGILSDDEDTSGPEELTLTVRDNGEIVSEEVSEINAAGNLNAKLVETENDLGPIIELSAVGDGGGAFEDTDGDGVAELQQDHADLRGGDLRNAGSVDTDDVSITNAAPGYDYVIFQDDNGHNYVMDKDFSVVAGGPDDINGVDGDDFAALFAYAVNNHPVHPSIKVDPPDQAAYRCRSTQTLNQVFALWGAGRNKTTIKADNDSVGGQDIFTMSLTSGQAILRIANIKFSAVDRDTNRPNMYFNLDNVNEVLLTDVEFRDAATWGIKSINNNFWNYISNCWFLNGAGFYFEGSIDLTVTGTKIADSDTDTKVENYDQVQRSGNVYKASAPPTEFVNVSNKGESGTSDNPLSGTYTELLSSHIEAPSDVSGSRSVDTQYTNDSGAVRLVNVVFESDGTQGFNVFLATTSEQGGSVVTSDVVTMQAGDLSGTTRQSVSCIVPPGGTYEAITQTGHDSIVSRWVERDMS